MQLAVMIQHLGGQGRSRSTGRERRSLIKTHGGLLLWALLPALASAQNSADYAAVPPLIIDTSTPNVMLVMSDDHELYKKAYPDYSDLDGDGGFDQTYKDSFTYSGYFDSNFCYSYSATVTYFVPHTSLAATIATNGHRCDNVATEL